MNKKQHFKEKLESIQRQIWDLEFKRFKTAEVREEIRSEYDSLSSRLEPILVQFTKEPNNKELEEQKTLLETDKNRFLLQIQALDREINGAPVSEEFPEGVQGLNFQIDSFYELLEMTKQYINTI